MEKVKYQRFLELPEDHRKSCSIAQEWEDEHGDKWVAVFMWAKAERFFDETLPDNLYLEFYNLKIDNDDACLDFIERYYITYVGEHKFDDSGAYKYTIDNLRFDQMNYRATFFWLFRKKAFLKRLISEQQYEGGIGGVENMAFWCLHCCMNKNLERCHPSLEIDDKSINLKKFEAKDFLSQSYLQLATEAGSDKISFSVCAICRNIIEYSGKGRPRTYCDDCDNDEVKRTYNKLYITEIERKELTIQEKLNKLDGITEEAKRIVSKKSANR